MYELPELTPDLKAFMTGSRVYGIPREDSDHDMVVRMSTAEEMVLQFKSDDPKKIMFGNLNIIAATSDFHFDAWHEGTRRLICIKPVVRPFAIEVFEQLGLRKHHEPGAYPPAMPTPTPENPLAQTLLKWMPLNNNYTYSIEYEELEKKITLQQAGLSFKPGAKYMPQQAPVAKTTINMYNSYINDFWGTPQKTTPKEIYDAVWKSLWPTQTNAKKFF